MLLKKIISHKHKTSSIQGDKQHNNFQTKTPPFSHYGDYQLYLRTTGQLIDENSILDFGTLHANKE